MTVLEFHSEPSQIQYDFISKQISLKDFFNTLKDPIGTFL